MAKKKRPKYLNASQREDIYWAGALMGYFENRVQNYTGKPRTWLNSTMLSLECFLKASLTHLAPDESRAITNMINRVTPHIVADNFYTAGNEKNIIKIDSNLVDDLAEFALLSCRNCPEKPDSCNLRKVLLEIGVPPYVEDGPCQYWQKEG